MISSNTEICTFINSSNNFPSSVTSRVNLMAAPSSTFFAPRDSLCFNTNAYESLHCRRGSRFIVRARRPSTKDPYTILGVSKNATKSEIKTAYRKMAQNYHPDVNKEPGAKEKFKEISSGYKFLLDNENRSIYDKYTYEEPGTEAGPKDQGMDDEERYRLFDLKVKSILDDYEKQSRYVEYFSIFLFILFLFMMI